MGIKNILERNPIIPAIKDNITLEKALNSNNELVFIILSNIINTISLLEFKAFSRVILSFIAGIIGFLSKILFIFMFITFI